MERNILGSFLRSENFKTFNASQKSENQFCLFSFSEIERRPSKLVSIIFPHTVIAHALDRYYKILNLLLELTIKLL